jgi:RimJ/RimL family protein N-acetyltransferase
MAEPTTDFIAARTTIINLKDGTPMLARPIIPEDKEKLIAGFARLSEESKFRRFLGYMDKLRAPLLRYLTEIDYVDHFAWIGLDADDREQRGIGVARYVRLRDDPTAAEAAIVVADDYHGRGAGTILLQLLGASALENGITRFVGEALADNEPIKELLEHFGAQLYPADAGEMAFELALPEREEEIKGTALYYALKAAAQGAVKPRRPRSHEKERRARIT